MQTKIRHRELTQAEASAAETRNAEWRSERRKEGRKLLMSGMFILNRSIWWPGKGVNASSRARHDVSRMWFCLLLPTNEQRDQRISNKTTARGLKPRDSSQYKIRYR